MECVQLFWLVGYLNDELWVQNTFQAAMTLHSEWPIRERFKHRAWPCTCRLHQFKFGTTGEQILWKQGGSVGEPCTDWSKQHRNLLRNEHKRGLTVAVMNLGQIAIGDSTSPVSHAFSAGDHFILESLLPGHWQRPGKRRRRGRIASTDQVTFFTPCTLGINASFTVTKSGEFTGSTSASMPTWAAQAQPALFCRSCSSGKWLLAWCEQ